MRRAVYLETHVYAHPYLPAHCLLPMSVAAFLSVLSETRRARITVSATDGARVDVNGPALRPRKRASAAAVVGEMGKFAPRARAARAVDIIARARHYRAPRALPLALGLIRVPGGGSAVFCMLLFVAASGKFAPRARAARARDTIARRARRHYRPASSRAALVPRASLQRCPLVHNCVHHRTQPLNFKA